MFELNYPTYQNVLSSVETLETELQKMFENHRDSVLNLSLDWHGSTSLIQRNLMVKSLSEGSHYEAFRYTSGIRKIMEDYQIPIEQLMARREQLGEQLKQDDYVMPDLSYHTENDLIIDYTMLDALKGNCKSALTYGNGAADVVNDMISEALYIASGWVNLGEAQELLNSGIKKINRLENYITELNLFKGGMTELEYDLIYEMYVVIRELGDTTLEFTEFKPPIAQPRQLISSMEDNVQVKKDFGEYIVVQKIINYLKKIVIYIREIDERRKEKYYDMLSEEIRKHVCIDDLVVSKDGFIMLTKSVADILLDMGVSDTNTSETNDSDVAYYYDDWYIYGIRGQEGGITYSLVKMREKENDSDIGDGDEPEVAISFIEFDINKLIALDIERTDAKVDILTDEIDRVVRQEKQSHNAMLQEYFSRTESNAPYIIADLYIHKVAKMAKDNKLELPNNFEDAPERITNVLMKINEETGRVIYDKENMCINIEDINNLSDGEKYAILSVYTSNVSYNSFAAEVEFHSDALVDLRRKIPYFGKKFWYESAIRANMGFGEEKESNIGGGFDEYYDLDSKIVRRQSEVHGER